MGQAKQVYFNEAQIAFVSATQKTRCWVGGRGGGKSVVLAWILRLLMEKLRTKPDKNGKRYGGKIYFAGTTIEQMKADIIPEIKKKLRDFGIVEDVHYVDGKAPPDYFDDTLSPIEEYDNCITFFTGFQVHLKSTIRWKSKKGGSYDGGILDEAAETNGAKYKKMFLPAIRGNLYRFDPAYHHWKIVLSNLPYPELPSSYWVYEFREQAKTHPEKVFYMETSALVNKAVLGEEWFVEQRAILGEDEYNSSILNKEQRQLPTGFYHRLNREKHCYTNPLGQSDVRASDLLEVSFDFGGKFNCCSVWQEDNGIERCLRQFFVKREGKIATLVRKFCTHFRGHLIKYVRVWGEPRGWDADPNGPSTYELIISEFESQGWMCEVRVQPGYKTKSHKARYLFNEKILAEEEMVLPVVRFNEEHCPDLLRALELCDVSDDYQKIKTMEKDPSYPQEHAPHFTDTVDYYLFEKHAWRMLHSNARAGGVW